jgi:hypothetical protein
MWGCGQWRSRSRSALQPCPPKHSKGFLQRWGSGQWRWRSRSALPPCPPKHTATNLKIWRLYAVLFVIYYLCYIEQTAVRHMGIDRFPPGSWTPAIHISGSNGPEFLPCAFISGIAISVATKASLSLPITICRSPSHHIRKFLVQCNADQ